MAIELVTKYLPYVDELFAAESKKSLLTNNDFDWTGSHTIKVYKIGTSAMNDYDRDGSKSGATGSRYGAIENLAASTQSTPPMRCYSCTLYLFQLFIIALDERFISIRNSASNFLLLYLSRRCFNSASPTFSFRLNTSLVSSVSLSG